jgi:hypothetical protein
MQCRTRIFCTWLLQLTRASLHILYIYVCAFCKTSSLFCSNTHTQDICALCNMYKCDLIFLCYTLAQSLLLLLLLVFFRYVEKNENENVLNESIAEAYIK